MNRWFLKGFQISGDSMSNHILWSINYYNGKFWHMNRWWVLSCFCVVVVMICGAVMFRENIWKIEEKIENCFLLTFDKINFNMLIKLVINMWRLYRYINSKIIYSQIVGNNSNHIFFRKQFDKRWRQTNSNNVNRSDDWWIVILTKCFCVSRLLTRELAARMSLLLLRLFSK